jgi:PLD-like domain
LSKTSFLINDNLWQVLSDINKSPGHIDAAIAYLGNEGSRLLPLKRGDCLVVDLSPATVRAGSTNPYEIGKLIKRGVQVFTRRNLHAKIVIADKKVLVGSANISKNSHDILDEAALLTDDPIILRQAKEFLNRICIEPVLPEYLAKCKSIYKSPRFSGKRLLKSKRTRQATYAKLWLVNLVDYLSIPDSETEAFEKSEGKALTLLKDEQQSALDTFHWPYKPKMADELEPGDWIIQCIKHKDTSISVRPPARLIFTDHYTRNQQGKERYLFHLEYPKRGEGMSWVRFKKKLSSILGKQVSWPRTKAIRDTQKADDLLRLWTSKGRISRK